MSRFFKTLAEAFLGTSELRAAQGGVRLSEKYLAKVQSRPKPGHDAPDEFIHPDGMSVAVTICSECGASTEAGPCKDHQPYAFWKRLPL